MSKVCTSMDKNVKWKDITPGGLITESGNADEFHTGDWRSEKPIWSVEKCKQCNLCFPVCPDSSIVVGPNAEMKGIDYDHCKGCGVCAATCPFGALEMVDEK